MDPALVLSRFGWDLDLRTSLRRELASSSLLDPAKSSMLGPAVPGHKAAAENRSLNMSASLGTMASTTASFIGSGISDLRATVMAQQRQLDGLTDKTAGVLSAMHAELRQETQAHCHRDMNDVARRVEEEIPETAPEWYASSLGSLRGGVRKPSVCKERHLVSWGSQ